MKKTLLLACILALLLSLCQTAALADVIIWDTSPAGYTVYVLTSDGGVNFRSGPGTEYGKILEDPIPDYTELYIDYVSDGWGKTTYNGYTGWVALSQTTTELPSSSTAESTAETTSASTAETTPASIAEPTSAPASDPATPAVTPQTAVSSASSQADQTESPSLTAEATSVPAVGGLFSGGFGTMLIIGLFLLVIVVFTVILIIVMNKRKK